MRVNFEHAVASWALRPCRICGGNLSPSRTATGPFGGDARRRGLGRGDSWTPQPSSPKSPRLRKSAKKGLRFPCGVFGGLLSSSVSSPIARRDVLARQRARPRPRLHGLERELVKASCVHSSVIAADLISSSFAQAVGQIARRRK